MSVKLAKKIQRNGLNNDKKRSTEDRNFSKKDTEKKNQEEDREEKTKIDWEEEKDIIKKYLSQKYPLTTSKISRIIQEQAKKYIHFQEYKAFFLREQSKNLSDNIKKAKKLSNAPKDVKSYFDTEAKESNNISSSDDDEEEEEGEDIDDESEGEKNNSYDDEEEAESNNERKRKSESSTLDDVSPKREKKDTPTAKWLPNGDKVMKYSYTFIFTILKFLLFS